MFLYWIALVLAEPGIAQASFIHSPPDSFPYIARKFPLKCGADRTFTNGIFKPLFNLMKVEPSRTRGSIASEVPGTCAREVILVFRAYYVAHFDSHGGEIRLRSCFKLIILAGPFPVRCFHHSLRLTRVPLGWVIMSLG
jgi:hypothetical protein